MLRFAAKGVRLGAKHSACIYTGNSRFFYGVKFLELEY